MPMIPINNRRIGISMQVPGASESVAQAGAESRAMAQVAGQVSDLGTKLLEKRQLAKEADYANKQSVADVMRIQDLERQMKLQYEQNPEGYYENFSKEVNKMRQDSIGAAPSNRARDMYSQRFSSVYDQALVRANGFEHVQTVKNFQTNLVKGQEDILRSVVMAPSPEFAISQMQHNAEILSGEGVRGTLISDEEAEGEIKSFNNRAVKALLGGYDANRHYGAALQALNDERFSSNLSPTELATYKKKFSDRVESYQRERKADLVYKVSNEIKLAEMGGQISQADYERNIQEIRGNPQFSATEKMRYIGEYSLARSLGEVSDVLKDNPRATWEDVQNYFQLGLESLPKEVSEDKTFHTLLKAEGQRRFEKLKLTIAENQNEDGLASALSRNQELANLNDMAGSALEPVNQLEPQSVQARRQFLSEARAYQEERGISVRVATKGEAKNLATTIKGLPNAQARANAIDSLKVQYGQEFSLLMDHLAEADDTFGGLSHIGAISDPVAQRAMLETVFDRKAIEDNFKGYIKDTPYTSEELEQEVETAFSSARQGLTAQASGTHNLTEVNGLRKLVITEAQKNMAEKNISPERAARLAAETIIDRNFITGDVGGNPNTFLPRKIGVGGPIEKNLESFFEVYSNPVNLAQDFDPYVPSGFQEFDLEVESARDRFLSRKEGVIRPTPQVGDLSPSASRYLRQVAENGRWVLDESKQNMKLVIDQGGEVKPVYSKKEGTNDYDKPITVPLHRVYSGYNDKTRLTSESYIRRFQQAILGEAKGRPRDD